MNQPICPNFDRCGGCLYLHLETEAYKSKKINFIKNSFAHEGIDLTLNDFILIPFGTRRRATFAFKKGIVGFNEQKSHKIIPLDNCPALTKKLSNLLPLITPLCKELNKSGDIFMQETSFGVDVHIKTGKEKPTLNERMILAEFASNHDIVRLFFNNDPIIEKMPIPLPVDLFLQPSFEGEAALKKEVLSNISETDKTAIDLFCGAGTFTLPLKEKGLKVKGYDLAGPSLNHLKELGFKRDLFRNPLMRDEFEGIDLVVMDPPRAGAKNQAIELAKSTVKKVIMISCNPVTAARDAKIFLDGGWKIIKAIAVDQFIYTNHIEIICILEK